MRPTTPWRGSISSLSKDIGKKGCRVCPMLLSPCRAERSTCQDVKECRSRCMVCFCLTCCHYPTNACFCAAKRHVGTRHDPCGPHGSGMLIGIPDKEMFPIVGIHDCNISLSNFHIRAYLWAGGCDFRDKFPAAPSISSI